ncbi:preprotein translocase subunit SecY [Methylacidiphilum caldifontis]|uniref:preprotein translocase subunit SecY n=1 Tax=Methylacidiphilum caldifontis TaxID=2795386 RepID=UPI001A8C85A9|nr:preprotein translocase subunit SecY [Methylacidiphilum caldifontis]QSR89303.1 preprotein translocase subunit SecY [Methylacidiphilum caldifontis]
MLSAFVNIFKIPELRSRILFTLGVIIIIRLGSAIPTPGVNPNVLGEFFRTVVDQQAQGSVVGMLNLFSGGALENCAIFSLSVMPYISASIMMQLLTTVVPTLGKLAREEGGRQKLTQYARMLTVLLCLFQGYLLAIGFENPESIPLLHGIHGIIEKLGSPLVPEPGWGFRLITMISLTTGTLLLMWLGEQISDKGIGNGVSLIITIGILARLPAGLVQGWSKLISPSSITASSPFLIALLLLFLFGVIATTVAMTQAMRKITIHYAKQVRGNRIYGGQTSFLPLKVNYAGVMPIIFAQAILLFPSTLIGFLVPNSATAARIANSLSAGSLYYALSVVLIFFFSYFWVATQFNPVQIADDLKKHGGFIPGIRPGAPTSEFLDYSMTRLTLAGAVFLSILAVLPMVVQNLLGIPAITAQFFGGTSLLIVVGVILDTMRQTETYLLQRNYDGFLKKRKLSKAAVGTISSDVAKERTLVWIYTFIGILVIAGITVSLFKK